MGWVVVNGVVVVIVVVAIIPVLSMGVLGVLICLSVIIMNLLVTGVRTLIRLMVLCTDYHNVFYLSNIFYSLQLGASSANYSGWHHPTASSCGCFNEVVNVEGTGFDTYSDVGSRQ